MFCDVSGSKDRSRERICCMGFFGIALHTAFFACLCAYTLEVTVIG